MRELPPVEEIRDGLWSMPVVIPNNPLGYTLVYLFATESGPVLVDTGWPSDDSWHGLLTAMKATGHDIADTYGVLITHAHVDHHGLSERVRQASSAWVAMHPEDAWAVTRVRSNDEQFHLQTAAYLLQSGASAEDLEALPDYGSLRRPELPSNPTRLFADDDIVDVPGWTVRAIWTPGHSPGHTCFAVDAHGLLLSGDHVLPRISPHIGLYSEDTDLDPLGDYLDSLAKLMRETPSLVLPAHQEVFEGLGARLTELTDHHHERLDAVRATLGAGDVTLWDIASAMPWSRSWEEIPAPMKRAAVSEALAHLRYLERHGEVEKVPGAWPTSYRKVLAA